MDANSIAERIRLEREILTHVRQAVRLAVRAPFDLETSAEWHERLCFLLDSFGRHMRRLFTIEEEGGYLDFVVDSQRPNLAQTADRLLAEHRELVEIHHEVLKDAKTISVSNLANLHELRQRVIGFLGRLARHFRDEKNLCFDALMVDIGGEG